jgi:hypothetical protein
MASTLTKRELSEEILFGFDNRETKITGELSLSVGRFANYQSPARDGLRHRSDDQLEPKLNVATGQRTVPVNNGLHQVDAVGLIKLPEFAEVERSGWSATPLLFAPYAVPEETSARSARRAPLMVRANRLLQTILIGACALVVLGYGLDVAVSNDVTRQQEQTSRLSEENSELSAKLLKTVAYYSLQQSGPARFGLRSPEHVLIVKEVPAPKIRNFKPRKNYLPILSGY